MWMKVLLAFDNYMGRGLIITLFLGIVAALFVLEKRKPMRIMFVYLPIILLILFLNPFVSGLFFDAVGEEVYYRILWLIPVSIEIGYGITLLATMLQGKKRTLFLTCAALIVVTGGSFIYQDIYYSKAQNAYHMPQAVVDICDTVHVDGREVMVAMPMEFVNFVRQYDPCVCMPYGRDADLYDLDLRYYMEEEELEWDVLIEMARQYNCHYIVLAQDKLISGSIEDIDVEFVGTFDGYCLYKDTTQYFGL